MGNSRAASVSAGTQTGHAAKPCHLSLCRHLSKLPEIDAVFTWTDDCDVVHVYSVVHDFQSKFYDKLMKKERLVERDFPEIPFEFHVRAHQGRKPERAVPVGSEPVFVK
jgi:hypothetical protein